MLLLLSSIMAQITTLEFCHRNVIVILTSGLNSEVLANTIRLKASKEAKAVNCKAPSVGGLRFDCLFWSSLLKYEAEKQR